MKTKNAGKTAGVVATSRRRHSEEFVKQALALAERQGMAAAARSLRLAPSLLYRWRTDARAEAEMTVEEKAEAIEMAKLRKQVSALSEELEFLKKAAAYFAKMPR